MLLTHCMPVHGLKCILAMTGGTSMLQAAAEAFAKSKAEKEHLEKENSKKEKAEKEKADKELAAKADVS